MGVGLRGAARRRFACVLPSRASRTSSYGPRVDGAGRAGGARRGRPGQGRAAAAGPLLASTVRVRAARGDARAGLWDGKALTGMPTLEPDELSSSESSSAATFAAIAAEPALRPRRCAKARALQQASPPLLDQRPSRTAVIYDRRASPPKSPPNTNCLPAQPITLTKLLRCLRTANEPIFASVRVSLTYISQV